VETSLGKFISQGRLDGNLKSMRLGSRRREQPNASQRLRRLSFGVIGLSALVLLCSVPILLSDHHKLYGALPSIMALWGIATGIGLLRVQPWTRLSMLVFYGMLTVFGAVLGIHSVIQMFGATDWTSSTLENDMITTLLTAAVAVIAFPVGLRGVWFFSRNEVTTLLRAIP